MNADQVGELLAAIRAAEAKLGELQAAAAAQARLVAGQEREVAGLKKDLAAALKDYLEAPEAPARRRRAVTPRKDSQMSLVREVFADGATYSAADVADRLKAKGQAVSHVGIKLSRLAQLGELQRVGRGSYRKR